MATGRATRSATDETKRASRSTFYANNSQRPTAISRVSAPAARMERAPARAPPRPPAAAERATSPLLRRRAASSVGGTRRHPTAQATRSTIEQTHNRSLVERDEELVDEGT